jgi:2,3-bisphosphoglycerate-independent phosphoglycerate mutase
MPDGRTYPLVALVILDGWGIAPPGPGNAIELAETPVFDRLWRDFPHAQLAASGPAVGLPEGQMGNSEVGHLTIGSGRILFQDLVRVNRAVESGELFENEVLRGAFERGENVHLLGLVSHGGVHSHVDHLQALLTFEPEKTWIHAFTDGRDVSPHSAVHDLTELPLGRIATVAGRYYAMDRDKRWDRTDRALRAIVDGEGEHADDPIAAVQASYDRGITDEFIEPVVIDGRPRLDPERDTAIFFNFRPDRTRQLSEKLGELGVDLTTMTRYRDDFDFPVVFPEHVVENTLAEVLSAHGVRQLHSAETEKYAHVTYFLDGGREEPFASEERILVDSPRDVPSGQLRQRRHGGSHGRDPCRRAGGRDDGRVPGARRGCGRAGGRRLARDRRSRQRRAPSAGGRQPPHGPHDEPRSGAPYGSRSPFAGRGALRRRSDDFGPARPGWVNWDGWYKSRTNPVKFRSILPPPCRCPSLTMAFCGRRSGAMNELSRSSSALTRFRSTTTSCAWSAIARSPRI